MYRLRGSGKITNIHIHAKLLVCFSFSTKKKTEKQKKKEKRRRYCLLLLLGRADGAGETTKRKAWPTSSGNREEKVCVYVAATG
jgi:hypothetical protein